MRQLSLPRVLTGATMAAAQDLTGEVLRGSLLERTDHAIAIATFAILAMK
jgi:hypothetical protein